MKLIQIMAIFALIGYSHSMIAKNKQQLFFTNEYGQPVVVKITWKSNNFPYFTSDEVVDIREHDKNLMIKAPYSHYKLVGMSASPKSNQEQIANVASEDQDFEIPLIASNEDILTEKHVHNKSYFIMKASHKKHAQLDEPKIYIDSYASQQKYAMEIAREEQYKKTTAQQAIPVVQAVPAEQPIRVAQPVRAEQPVQQAAPFNRPARQAERSSGDFMSYEQAETAPRQNMRNQAEQHQYSQPAPAITASRYSQPATPSQTYNYAPAAQRPIILSHPYNDESGMY